VSNCTSTPANHPSTEQLVQIRRAVRRILNIDDDGEETNRSNRDKRRRPMETTATREKCIRLTTRLPDQKIALRGVRFRSAVAALAERTTVEQTFVNQESIAIEAIYTFPLPRTRPCAGSKSITGDRVLTGVVEENEKAIEKYDAAIDRGDAAYLLEQERPDVFTIRVGNINPKQAATIRLTYVRAVKVVDRQIRLAYPTTIAPRYVPAASSAPDPLEAQIDGRCAQPPKVAMCRTA
jgi:hypothetical protein